MKEPFRECLEKLRQEGDETPVVRVMNGEDNVQTTQRGKILHSTTQFGKVATQQQLENFTGKENLSEEPVDLVDSGLHDAESLLPTPMHDAMTMFFRCIRM